MYRLHRGAAASGFTLVELMVVIAIIGLLMALLLPAVQLARETARRASCTNNLRQVGAAIHMYHDCHQAFPPGGISPYPYPRENYTTWTIQILPYLEQRAIYDLYSQLEANESPANKVVRNTFIPVYSCPSDVYRNVPMIPNSGRAFDNKLTYMPGSYRGVGGRNDGTPRAAWDTNGGENGGGSGGYTLLPRRWRGVFHVNTDRFHPETFANVSDGLSNTIMVGEYCTVPSKSLPASNGLSRRTFWAYTYGSYNRSDAVPESRTLLGDYDRCTSLGGLGGFETCNRAWGSLHTDTVSFLSCDGSVQSFGMTMDMRVFADSATIAGKEFAPLP